MKNNLTKDIYIEQYMAVCNLEEQATGFSKDMRVGEEQAAC